MSWNIPRSYHVMMKNKNALREHRNECVPQKGSGFMINGKKKVKICSRYCKGNIAKRFN